jgi:hypothetical protein
MRLTDEEFGDLSLLSFNRLMKRVDARDEHDFFCAGIVAATFANAHCDKDKRPEGFTPLDFIPGYKPPAPKVLTPEEQVAAFERLLCPPEREIIRVINP